MGLGLYTKRAAKYIIKDHHPKQVTAQIVQRNTNECLKNRIILITGGGRGLGKAMALRLVEEGAKVIITGRNEDVLKNTAEEIKKYGSIEIEVFDVKNFAKGKDVIDRIYVKYGRLDCLINNAGISLHEKDFLDVNVQNMQEQFETNLFGGYFLTQWYIKKYLEQKQDKGNVIFISSERGDFCDNIPYGLTKVAVNSLVKGLSTEFYKKGIRVNGIAPGVTVSEMTKVAQDGNLDNGGPNDTDRYFIPEEVAEVVLFLASDFSGAVSGEIIHTNAGNSILTRFK